ncbi:hypothetical protein Catovirus_1_1045 [Catovirus CTV1]|uniref:Uncharacterized protein n=1 Tax=Catovirus CTV1 TaxID=1977631 RepID=A0A1V0SBA0_9VIRU|nr:hypothetical protein Catovirus_1_1045 [Catovirus CTV1]
MEYTNELYEVKNTDQINNEEKVDNFTIEI